MTFNPEKIFLPSIGVDMVFNMNDLAPYARSSIIYDTDHKSQTIVIAQPHTPFSKNTRFKDLHITTIISHKSRRIRVGLACSAFKIIDHYSLANKTDVQAVQVKYELPAVETNIRSAFRLPLSARYTIKGKILHNHFEYYTPKDFSIRDISLTGLGLVVPRKTGKALNPLSELKEKTILLMGIILIDNEKSQPDGTLPIKAQAARIITDASGEFTRIGIKFLNLTREREDLLNQFIHHAQIEELKRISRREL